MAKITVRSVRPAPAGFNENTVALASVAILLEQMDEPIELTRWVPGKNGAEGKEYKRGSITGGLLKLEEVSINKWTNRGGETHHYATINGFKFDRAISDTIANDAIRLFRQMPKGEPREQQHEQPRGQYDGSADPFETAEAMSKPAGNRPG